MRWQFWKRETAEKRSYSDAARDVILAQAQGSSTVADTRIGVVEACAGLWARGFASASVEPSTPATAALTPAVRAMIGRRLLEAGEILFQIQVTGGMVKLLPASSYELWGEGLDDWRYQLTINSPDALVTRYLDADAVVHLSYGEGVHEWWRGVGPIAGSENSRQLAAALECRLGQEANASVGNLLPIPDVGDSDKLQKDISALTGKNVLVPSTSTNLDDGGPAPRQEYQPRRLGANFPPSLLTARADVSEHLAAAAGVPGALLTSNADGTARRESWRQFLHGTLQPVADIICDELRLKLDEPGLKLSFDRLFASDLSGRARAFQSMVGGGMAVEKAAALAGLMEAEG